MRRLAVAGVSALLFVLIATFILGCGGNKGTTPVFTINLSPTSLSLNRGQTEQLSVQALDASNNAIAVPSLTYSSTDANTVTVSSSGLVCAGKWDANFVVCQTCNTGGNACPNTSLLGLGEVKVIAIASSGTNPVTSNSVTVDVHEPVDGVQVCLSNGGVRTCPAPPTNCVSQNGTAQYQIKATSSDPAVCLRIGSPAPCEVPGIGTVNWTVSPRTVAVTDVSLRPANVPVAVTAVTPGLGNLVGVVGTATSGVSGSTPFTTCAVKSIHVHGSGGTTDTSFSNAVGAAVPLTADVFDTNGVQLITSSATGSIIINPFLTWSSSNPAIATVDQNGEVSTVAPGVASITASCEPPACNINLINPASSSPLAVFSENVVTGTVTGTLATTVLVTTLATPASGTSNNVIPINSTSNTLGTTLVLPADVVVNSMVQSPSGPPVLLGTNQGLIRVANTATTPLPLPIGIITGTVLAADNTRAVVSDAANKQVFILLTAGPIVEAVLNTQVLVGAAVTSAAIAPDGSKILLVAGNKLIDYTPGLPPRQITLSNTATASSQGVAFFTTGAMSFVAENGGTGGDDVIPTCTDAVASTVAVGTPIAIAAVPATGPIPPTPPQGAMVDTDGHSIDQVTVSADGRCPPTINTAFNSGTDKHDFGLGNFTVQQLLVTPDSSLAIIISNLGILVYDLTAKTTSVIHLSGNAAPLTDNPACTPATINPSTGLAQGCKAPAGVTADGAMLYVGATDQTVHRVDLKAKNDVQAISVVSTMCPSTTPNCNPDFVVVNPSVPPATVNSITITPANPTIPLSTGTEQFTAMGSFSDGTTRNITNLATWLSSNTVVATIDPNLGLATLHATGTATISATYLGVTGTTTLTVQQ